MAYLMAALSAPPLAQMAGSWGVSRAREAREMDQEPTLPMIGTLTSVSTKKDGLEGHPGLRGTSRAPTTPQLAHGVASTLPMPKSSFLKPVDSLDSPAACAHGQGSKSV